MCFRLKLRLLMVLMLLVGCALGWVVRSADIQRGHVRAIRERGGTVKYDWEWKHGMTIPGGKPARPEWLADWIAIDCFGSVVSVRFIEPTDADLAHVARLTRLEELVVIGSSVMSACRGLI